jgi:hypothetical protein
MECLHERFFTVDIGADHLCAFGLKGLGLLAVHVPGDGPDFIHAILEGLVHHSAALGTGGPNHSEDLRHCCSSLRVVLLKSSESRFFEIVLV